MPLRQPFLQSYECLLNLISIRVTIIIHFLFDFFLFYLNPTLDKIYSLDVSYRVTRFSLILSNDIY